MFVLNLLFGGVQWGVPVAMTMLGQVWVLFCLVRAGVIKISFLAPDVGQAIFAGGFSLFLFSMAFLLFREADKSLKRK